MKLSTGIDHNELIKNRNCQPEHGWQFLYLPDINLTHKYILTEPKILRFYITLLAKQYLRQLWWKSLYINRVNTAQRDNLAENLLN